MARKKLHINIRCKDCKKVVIFNEQKSHVRCNSTECNQEWIEVSDWQMKNPYWTKENILSLIEINDKALIAGLMRLYSFQTKSEQILGSASEDNGVGFSGADSDFLTSLAKSYKKYNNLTGKQIQYLRRSMKKYAKQLQRYANGEIDLTETMTSY